MCTFASCAFRIGGIESRASSTLRMWKLSYEALRQLQAVAELKIYGPALTRISHAYAKALLSCCSKMDSYNGRAVHY